MRGSKTSRIIHVLGLILFLCSFSLMDTHAYQYTLGVSRKYYSGSNAYIVGTGNGSVSYERDYFTGLGFCTGYYYLNHNRNLSSDNDISLARQVLQYNSGHVNLSGDYINLKLTAGSTAWDTNNLYGPLMDAGLSLFRFNILKTSGSPIIPLTYTLGRFRIINKQAISGTNLSLYYLNPSSVDASTYINHTNSTFNTDADRDYNVNIKYYAQPCVPDAPITSSYTTKINGNADGLYTLARIPAFNFETNGYSNPNSGKPFTLGYTDFTTSNFIPGSLNVGSFNKDISFDSGIFLAGIKEPDVSSQPNEAFSQAYYYNTGPAQNSGFSFVTTNYVAAVSGTSNQRGIDPNTIKVTISFTGVDRTNYADVGTPCTLIITGDTNLGLSGLGYSRNRNQLGYSITISPETIRTLAKQQCSFTAIATGDIDLKRETVANIKWDAWDYANSMIISQDNNVETYAPANQITQATGYSFNSYSSAPLLSMATDTTSLINGSTVYNIPITNQNLRFTGTDDYAGVNSGTFIIIVSGYESSVEGLSNTRRTSGTPNRSYSFSNNDVSKFPFDLHNARYDYSGLVDFATKIGATTGTHFTISFKATDFVGNSSIKNYTFRTPTWPNRPKGTGALITTQTNTPINQINFIDNITQDTVADGVGGSSYNYLTYYPSSSGLITNFSYISGGTYINSTTPIVLTAHNGNVGQTIVTLTGLTFTYNGATSYLVGIPHVSSGGTAMLDYVATTFTFDVLATNIYGITGVITYTINVAPSCTESAGCTDPVYVFRGTTKAAAMAQQTAAIASGYEYLKATHRYPHWFAEIKQTGPNFYFTGTAQVQTLYCASTGNDLLINYGGYTGPQGTLINSPLSTDSTGTTLNISGGTIYQFGVFTASVSADYVVVADEMTVYINRPLTGRVFYSVCEFTGGTLDVFGCPVIANHNWTGDINWTKLSSTDIFTMTGWVEGGWLTGTWNGYVTGGSINNGNQFDFWSTGLVYDGGGYRMYVRKLSGDVQENITTSGNVSFDITNRTGSTATLGYEIYWIDNTPPQVTGIITNILPNQSVTLELSGSNVGQLSNSQVSNLIGDDEYIITQFSGITEAQLFENGYGSAVHTGGRYVAGSDNIYKMTHTMTFASNRTGYIYVADRAGNKATIYIDISGIGNLTNLVITVRPAFRPDPATNATGYSIVDGDFWFFVLSGTQWIQNYNSAKNPLTDPKITTNKYGTGIVSITAPASGSQYLVVFKGSGTVSAGFTGIWSDNITELNFFTGTFADHFSSDFVYKFSSGGNMEYYLKVGDTIANNTGDYDYVGTTDFSQINNYLTLGTNTLPFYRYDFDINTVISSMEQSMVLQARNSHGFIGWLDNNNILPMSNFITF